MKNVQDIVNMGLCTGCSTCYSSCKNGYISFNINSSKGFPIPSVESCDDCNNCLKVCPVSDLYEDDDE